MSKAACSHVAFARFALEHRLDPADLAELLLLAKKAFKAGERECSTPNYNADPARERFEAKAKTLRFATYWPGLWPAMKKTNKGHARNVYLPETSI